MSAIPPTSPTPCIARPADLLGGTTRSCGGERGDLNTLLGQLGDPAKLMPNDTIECPAGAVYDPVTIPVRTDSGWICVRSTATLADGTRVGPSTASQLFTIETPLGTDAGAAVTLGSGTAGWRFIGMQLRTPNDNHKYALLDTGTGANRLSLERSYLHGRTTGTLQRAIYALEVTDFRVQDCWISECQDPNGDSQAIFTRRGARHHFQNSEFQGAGENILIGDQDSGAATTDLTILRNHFFKPLAWFPFLPGPDGYPSVPNPASDGSNHSRKNLFEVKWGKRLWIEGNRFENLYFGGQDGTAILINTGWLNWGYSQDTSDILFQYNRVINVDRGFSINSLNGYNDFDNVTALGQATFGHLIRRWDANAGQVLEAARAGTADGIAVPPTRVALLHNLGTTVRKRFLAQLHQAADLWVEHNTCVPMTQQAGDGLTAFTTDFEIKGVGEGTPPVQQYGNFPRNTIRRNVFGRSLYSISPDGSDAAYDLWCGTGRDWAENVQYDYAGGYTSLVGLVRYGSAAAAGINPDDGTLTAGSPLKAGAGLSTDGKDIGVDFAALAQAESGGPVAAFTWAPVPDSLAIAFTDASHE